MNVSRRKRLEALQRAAFLAGIATVAVAGPIHIPRFGPARQPVRGAPLDLPTVGRFILQRIR